MSYFKRIEILSTDIVFVRYPGCEGHQRPCKGCPDFCNINEETAEDLGQSDLYEAYGTYECNGETWYDQTTVWQVTAHLFGDHEFARPVQLKGQGQTVGEAIADVWHAACDWETALAKNALDRLPDIE